MFAVLHIPDFPLHAVLRTDPSYLGQPAALFTGTGKKSLLAAATAAAWAAGLEPGMTAPQAVARCPSLLIRTPDAGAEAEARAAVLAVAFSLSPLIEDTGPGICTADLKGNDRATVARNAALAVAQLRRLDLPATAGIAPTPLLALYAGRSNRAELRPAAGLQSSGQTDLPQAAEAPDVYQAHVMAENASCSGVTLVSDAAEFLAPLPLATIDPTPELAAILAQWGLRTVGDFVALPREEIIRRFGAAGLALCERASGGTVRPLRPVVPGQVFAADLAFEQEVETLEPLLFILRRFLDRLALELVASQHVAAEIELTLRLDDDSRYERRFRLPEPTADVEILFRALHTHLESLQTAASISGVGLRLVPTRPLVRQHGLFDTGLRDPHGFAETLARVVAVVGSDRVGTPQAEDTHRPDAVRLITPPGVIPSSAPAEVHAREGLPLRRFRPPLPARLEFTGRQPTFLWTELFQGSVAEVHGPWRSSGEWWQRDRAWSRTEWDIALVNGGLYRLLLVNNLWFVEGEYD